VNVTAADITDQNFIVGLAIRGRVSAPNGGGLSNILVTVTGGNGVDGMTAQTNNAGYYLVSGLAPGTYTVTPTASGQSFKPLFRSVTLTNADATGVNFIGGFSISGRIATADGKALPNVLVTATGGFTALTNAAGYYSIDGLPSGGYTVTPSSAGLTFTPPSRNVTITNADVTGVNFFGGNIISGRITRSDGTGIPNVTVSLSNGATTTTNSAGYYRFTGLPAGNYTITPSGGGFTYNPPTRNVTVGSTDISGQDFVGS
jgi:inhibitor of cysteine peptidase